MKTGTFVTTWSLEEPQVTEFGHSSDKSKMFQTFQLWQTLQNRTAERSPLH